MKAFNHTIASLIPDWPKLDPGERAEVSVRCAAFVRQQLCLAPAHIRIGFWTLFIAYRLFALPGTCVSSRESPSSTLAAFSELPLPMVSGLERILRTMTLLCYFEQPEVLAALGEETIAMRQAAFRAKRSAEHVA